MTEGPTSVTSTRTCEPRHTLKRGQIESCSVRTFLDPNVGLSVENGSTFLHSLLLTDAVDKVGSMSGLARSLLRG
jgi:hypothetical protein